MLHSFLLKGIACLGMLLLVNFSSLAQMPEENVVPDPLKPMEPSFYPVLKKPVKSFIYLIDKDSISKSYFSNTGNEEIKLDYENNKPYYKAVSKYNGNLKTENKFYINNILQSTTTYKYDNNKNLVEWQAIKTVYDNKNSTSKQVEDIHWLIAYNANKKLKRKHSIDAAKVTLMYFDYYYDNANKLVERDELQWKDKYEYNNGFVAKKYRIFKNDNSVYDSSEYKFNDNWLLASSSDKYNVNEYTYDSLQLTKIISTNKKDGTVQEITFSYQNNLVSRVQINTTDIKMKPQFYFKTDYLYFAWKKNEVNNLKLKFFYDNFKNITEIKYYIKDIYKYSKYFIYEYY